MCPCQDGIGPPGIGGANVCGVPISILVKHSLETVCNISGLGLVLAAPYCCKGSQICMTEGCHINLDSAGEGGPCIYLG